MEWNAFASGWVGSTYCHRFEWKRIIEIAYRLRTLFLSVRSSGRWIGVLPTAMMPHLPLRRPCAVSLPFCNYGGLIVDPSFDASEIRRLCLEYLGERGIAKVEIRRVLPSPGEAVQVTLRLNLPSTTAELWQAIGSKARNQIKKSQSYGLTLHWNREDVDDFYDVYAINVGRLGTPVHSRTFMREIVHQFGSHAEILTVRHGTQAIAGMLLIRHNESWADPFACSLPKYKQMNPNMLLYWEALRMAIERGARVFDFGRSGYGSGTFHFKKQWGAIPYPLDYHVYEKKILKDSSSLTRYHRPTARLTSRVWAHLPSSTQLWLGPKLRRWMT